MNDFCVKENINYEIINFDKLINYFNSDTISIIGADRILDDNSVINGIPSLELAKQCNSKIPFYVMAESFKKDNNLIIEEGFDLIPNHLIAEIISNKN